MGGDVEDGRAARGLSLVCALVGVTMNDGADTEAVDGLGEARGTEERKDLFRLPRECWALILRRAFSRRIASSTVCETMDLMAASPKEPSM